jgi:limonene-1,2-epoxide hydrolase
MTTEPERIVREFMTAMERLDYDTALGLVSDDISYTNMPLGPGSTVTGPAGVRAVLEPFFAPTITNEWVVKAVAVAGGTVFMERLDRHQFAGGWAELPVTGVFEVREGRIVSWREYFDFATIERAMAALA